VAERVTEPPRDMSGRRIANHAGDAPSVAHEPPGDVCAEKPTGSEDERLAGHAAARGASRTTRRTSGPVRHVPRTHSRSTAATTIMAAGPDTMAVNHTRTPASTACRMRMRRTTAI